LLLHAFSVVFALAFLAVSFLHPSALTAPLLHMATLGSNRTSTTGCWLATEHQQRDVGLQPNINNGMLVGNQHQQWDVGWKPSTPVNLTNPIRFAIGAGAHISPPTHICGMAFERPSFAPHIPHSRSTRHAPTRHAPCTTRHTPHATRHAPHATHHAPRSQAGCF
jgi:hypothetical protein